MSSVSTKCPGCGTSMPLPSVEAYKLYLRAGGLVVWYSCGHCGHRWRDAYDLHCVRQDLPWTEPPDIDEEPDK